VIAEYWLVAGLIAGGVEVMYKGSGESFSTTDSYARLCRPGLSYTLYRLDKVKLEVEGRDE